VAADFDYELSLQDIHMFGGARIPTDQLKNENLLRYTKGFHPEDEWMQRTWNPVE
jgi:hypothetical protein